MTVSECYCHALEKVCLHARSLNSRMLLSSHISEPVAGGDEVQTRPHWMNEERIHRRAGPVWSTKAVHNCHTGIPLQINFSRRFLWKEAQGICLDFGSVRHFWGIWSCLFKKAWFLDSLTLTSQNCNYVQLLDVARTDFPILAVTVGPCIAHTVHSCFTAFSEKWG